MLKNKRYRYFNIVEVALALAVVGLGMASILALFPVGLSASRNAIGNNCSADVAEEFMGYIKSFAEASTSNYDNLFVNSTAFSIPEASVVNSYRADPLEKANIVSADPTCTFLEELKKAMANPGTGDIVKNSSEFSDFKAISTTVGVWDNIFHSTDSTSKFLYIALQKAEESATPDFSAAVLLWKSKIGNKESGGSSISWEPGYDEISALNMEISWPLTKPYKEREKRYFYMIIKKPSN